VDEEAKDRRETTEATEKSAPEQQAEQAGPKKTGCQTAEQTAAEQAARTVEGAAGTRIARCARLRHGTLHRRDRWCCGRRRRRRKGAHAEAAETRPAADARVGRARHQRNCKCRSAKRCQNATDPDHHCLPGAQCGPNPLQPYWGLRRRLEGGAVSRANAGRWSAKNVRPLNGLRGPREPPPGPDGASAPPLRRTARIAASPSGIRRRTPSRCPACVRAASTA